MSVLQQSVAVVIGFVILAAVTGLCLKAPPGGAKPAQGTQVYRIHPAWFVFGAVGGLFLAGIFAFGSTVCEPDQKTFCLGCSVFSALFFAFFMVVMRSLSVTVDAERVSSKTLFWTRSVELRNVERAGLGGFVVEVIQKPDPATGKRRLPLTFLAGFRDTAGLIATIQARSGVTRA